MSAVGEKSVENNSEEAMKGPVDSYKDRVIADIRLRLKKLLNVDVLTSGYPVSKEFPKTYSRVFTRESVGMGWPEEFASPLHTFFWSQLSVNASRSKLPSLVGATNEDAPGVKATTSHSFCEEVVDIPKQRHEVRKAMSPVRAPFRPFWRRYAILELMEEPSQLQETLNRLELQCSFAAKKVGTEDVLEAVSFAGIVAPFPFNEEVSTDKS